MKSNKIIYVEDDESMRSMMHQFLKDDFDITVTPSVDEAFEICNKEEVAIAMADHHMDPITGVEFLHKMYDRFPETQRVLITGDTSSDLIFDALKEGRIHGFFYKPLDFTQLREELNEYVNRYRQDKSTNQKAKSLQEEIIKLREALYQRNSRIYHSFNSLRDQSQFGIDDKISSLYVSKFSHIKQTWEQDSEININQHALEEIHVHLEELILLSDEFSTNCFSTWLKTFKVALFLFQDAKSNVNSDISNIKKRIPQYGHTSCKSHLNEIADNIIVTKSNINRGDIHKKFVTIINDLISRIQLEIFNTEVFDSPALVENPIDKLGYFLVVKDQVTVYSRIFQENSKKIHPSLIGNLAVAVNDFSKELFDDFSGIQSIEQENGTLLIHRADQNIYYIALAYSDSYMYQVFLKEFANNSLDYFQSKSTNTYNKDEIIKLDKMIDNIIL